MANTQARFGFRHLDDASGGSPTYRMSTRAIQSTTGTAIGFGDPVQQVNATSPYITQMAGGAGVFSLPVVGIFQGCSYVPTGGGPPVWSPTWNGTAASDGVAYIIDSPNALFLAATTLTAIATSAIGHAVSFTGGAPATTGGGFSIATIDASTLGTAASGTAVSSLPFRVVGLYQGVGNGSDPTTSYNWVVVGFNNQINRVVSA